MRYIFIFTLLFSFNSFAQNTADRLCEVKICNKLSRVSTEWAPSDEIRTQRRNLALRPKIFLPRIENSIKI